MSRARGSVRPASRARRRWRMRRCVASLLARRPRHLAADNALLRSSDGHVTTFAHSFLCLRPHQHRLASQNVRVLVRAKSTAQTARAASDPIVVADLRCVVLGRAARIAWGSSTVPTGSHARPASPGSTLTSTTLPATIVHRSVRDKPPLLTRRATHSNGCAGWAGEGGRHGHVQKVQARHDAGGGQAVLHQVWRSVPQTHRVRCAPRFCADRAICCGQGKSRICW